MSSAKKILIIEDDEDLLHLLSNTLKKEGFAITSTVDGVRGFALAKEEAYDLILLDLDVPGIEGLTLLKKLREHSENKETPVIIFSNSADIENLSQAMEYGVLSYLAKSDWELEGVVQKVREALKLA